MQKFARWSPWKSEILDSVTGLFLSASFPPPIMPAPSIFPPPLVSLLFGQTLLSVFLPFFTGQIFGDKFRSAKPLEKVGYKFIALQRGDNFLRRSMFAGMNFSSRSEINARSFSFFFFFKKRDSAWEITASEIILFLRWYIVIIYIIYYLSLKIRIKM